MTSATCSAADGESFDRAFTATADSAWASPDEPLLVLPEELGGLGVVSQSGLGAMGGIGGKCPRAIPDIGFGRG